MPNPTKDNGPLDGHILETYFYLRLGMAILAFVFPLLLWWGGKFALGTPLQSSMSAYYHTELRDVFVGILVAIGFFLMLYKGFSQREDWTLNFAGILAIGVAVFPMSPSKNLFPCNPLCVADCMQYSDNLDRTFQPLIDSGLHGVCAVVFFVAIFFVCAVFSKETVKTIDNRKRRTMFTTVYWILGTAMILFPLSIWVVSKFGLFGVGACDNRAIFFIEGALVWVFAIFWGIKTWELKISQAEHVYLNRRGAKADEAKKSS